MKILHTVDARVGRRCRVVRIDEVIGRLGSAAGPDFRVAVRAQGVVLLRLGLALTDLVRFVQRRRGRTASAHLSVPVAIRLQSDGIGFHEIAHVGAFSKRVSFPPRRSLDRDREAIRSVFRARCRDLSRLIWPSINNLTHRDCCSRSEGNLSRKIREPMRIHRFRQ